MQRMCRNCRKRPALYRSSAKHSDGRVRSDKDHDLCFRCFRSLANALEARNLRRAK